MTEPARKRPAWIWAITLWKVSGLAFAILSVALVYFGVIPESAGDIPVNASGQETLSLITPIDIAVDALIMLLMATGTWLLFVLDSRAPFVLTAALLVNIVFSFVFFGSHNIMPPVGLGVMIGWGIEFAICFYAWNLRHNGVLTDKKQRQADVFN